MKNMTDFKFPQTRKDTSMEPTSIARVISELDRQLVLIMSDYGDDSAWTTASTILTVGDLEKTLIDLDEDVLLVRECTARLGKYSYEIRAELHNEGSGSVTVKVRRLTSSDSCVASEVSLKELGDIEQEALTLDFIAFLAGVRMKLARAFADELDCAAAS